MTLTALDRVTAELDRLSSLDTVTRHDSRADSFGVGARWAIRMIREAIARDSVPADGAVDPELAALLARCPAAHGGLGRICELPAGHSGMHTGDGPNGGAVWEGDASA
jgi:hypothetical protein